MPMSCLDAAERVIREAGKPLHYKKITRAMKEKGYWNPRGKTPAAVTVSAILRKDVSDRGDRSRFVRVAQGVYGLRNFGSSSIASPVSTPVPAVSPSAPTTRPTLDGLENEIRKVRAYSPKKKLNESKTRSFLVEPILKHLGWDSPDVMEPEYPVGGRQRVKVDVALLRREKIEVMVEVKPDKLSERHEKQLQEYCRLDDVSLGVLTNGRIWKLYYGMHANKKRYLAEVIDITQGDVHVVACQMEKFLGFNRSKMERKRAFRSAWENRGDPQRAIQGRWNEQRDTFVSLLTDALMKSLQLSGETIPEDMVRAFVRKKIFSLFPAKPDTPERAQQKPYTPRQKTALGNKLASRSRSGQRPAPDPCPETIEVFGQRFEVKSWRMIVLVFLREAHRKMPKEFLDVVRRWPKKLVISAEKPTLFRAPLRVENSNVWVEGSANAAEHWRVCERTRLELKLPEDVLIPL